MLFHCTQRLPDAALMWNGLSIAPRNFVLRAFRARSEISEGCQGRPQAARRGSLYSPVIPQGQCSERARQGSLGRLALCTSEGLGLGGEREARFRRCAGGQWFGWPPH